MLAIIPARGGSKGLPNKNIKPFCGVPLIAHSIRIALQAKSISRLIVSTDSEEIAGIAKSEGAEIPFMRPEVLASDSAMAIDTYIYTCNRLAQQERLAIEEFVVLQPTSPLRTASDIDEAVNIFRRHKADSVVSVNEAPCPIEWYRCIDSSGVLREYAREEITQLKNRQEYKKAFIPNGSVFVFNRTFIEETRSYYSERTYPYVMPVEHSIDIDTELDFLFAEYIFNKRVSL